MKWSCQKIILNAAGQTYSYILSWSSLHLSVIACQNPQILSFCGVCVCDLKADAPICWTVTLSHRTPCCVSARECACIKYDDVYTVCACVCVTSNLQSVHWAVDCWSFQTVSMWRLQRVYVLQPIIVSPDANTHTFIPRLPLSLSSIMNLGTLWTTAESRKWISKCQKWKE